jgi:periplasmic nitrate reductase NapD
MSILGVVVRAMPAQQGAVADRLATIAGVDVIAAHGDGRFVLVIEDTHEPRAPTAAATLGALATWPDVLNTSLVYEYSGPESPAPDAPVTAYQAWRSDLGSRKRDAQT